MNRISFRILSTVSLAALMTISAQAAMQADKSGTQLTQDQVRALAAKASTPADHAQVASYYRAKAEQYKAEAQEHARMLADYKADATKVNTKNYATTVGHCQWLVNDLQRAAADAQKLAETHELAAGIKPPTPAHDMSSMKTEGKSHDCCPGTK